jgi:hypothetical protein
MSKVGVRFFLLLMQTHHNIREDMRGLESISIIDCKRSTESVQKIIERLIEMNQEGKISP